MKYAICILLALSLCACSKGIQRSTSVAAHTNINSGVSKSKRYVNGRLQKDYKSKIINYCPPGQLQKVGAKCQ